MDFIVRYALVLVVMFLAITLSAKRYDGYNYFLLTAEPVCQLTDEAERLVASGSDLDSFLLYRRAAKNIEAQEQSMGELLRPLAGQGRYGQQQLYAANNFLVYGTTSTAKLDRWQRYQRLRDFVNRHGRLPGDIRDWKLVLES